MNSSSPPAWPSKSAQETTENTPIMRPAAEVRSIGFEDSAPTDAKSSQPELEVAAAGATGTASEPSVAPAPRPHRAPLAKRPKGRFFVGTVLLGSMVLLGGQIWATWFQTEYYGEVTGRVVQVATPWDGNVKAWCVAEGQRVRQGELLAVMHSPRLEEQLAATNDELRIAESMLSAELSKIQTAAQYREEELRKSVSEYYEIAGDYLREQSRHQQLQARLDRLKGLAGTGAVSEESLEDLQWQEQGQRQRMESLAEAVSQLRDRAEQEDPGPQAATAQMQPFWLRVETLANRIQRLRETLASGQLVSPVDGVVTQRVVATSEYTRSLAPVVDVLASDSLETVLYVAESDLNRFAEGTVIPLRFATERELVDCCVTRVEPVLRAVPSTLSRYYNRGQKLVAVHMEPVGTEGDFELRLGMLVKLPRWSAMQDRLWEILP